MRSLSRFVTMFVALGMALLATTGGCNSIGEAIDCEQMCEQLETCIDSDLNVQRCSERCEDEVDNATLREQLDDCTDCLDRDYACGEIPEKCSICQVVADAILE